MGGCLAGGNRTILKLEMSNGESQLSSWEKRRWASWQRMEEGSVGGGCVVMEAEGRRYSRDDNKEEGKKKSKEKEKRNKKKSKSKGERS